MTSDSFSDSTDFVHPTERALVDAAWAQVERFADGSRPAADASQGLSIPGYRILGEVHRGGQGVVYQAIQESTRRKVAIKVLKEGPFADSTELARFDREVDVLSRINHPHIVAIHDRGLAAGHAYYVMDYIPGRPLDAYVAGADLSVDEILGLFVKVCDAINAAHLRGVIHRDLKPGNIRVDDQGEPKILDFGLAKLAQDSGASSSEAGMTLTGQFIGSLPWASPEQTAGGSDVLDIRTDVYSLGVLLYQLLSGRFPYPVSGRIDDVVRHIGHTSPARLSTTSRRIDHDLELITQKCLSKEPELRYQSAGELARDLRCFLADEPVSATSPSAAYRLRKFVLRYRGPVVAGAIVAVALSTAAGVSVAFGLSEARQRRAAEADRTRANKAEGEAKARADELEKVAGFTEAQLSGIDAETMGVRLRASLLEKARESAERSKLPPDEVKARTAELERLLAGPNFTAIAMESLDENYFQPALSAIEKQFGNQTLVKARLLQTLVATQHRVGLRDGTVKVHREALEIFRRELGDEHPVTLTSLNSLGKLLEAQGELVESEACLREALHKRQQLLGDDHPDTLTSLSILGQLLRSRGEFLEADHHLRTALEKRRRVLGNEHADTIDALLGVAILLKYKGDFDDAEGYHREAYQLCRRVHGDEHRNTINALANLGLILHTRGNMKEAEPCLRKALEARRRVLGDDHPATLTSISNMGVHLETAGKAKEAESYYREALERRRRVLGNDHPDTVSSIITIAGLSWAQGNLEAAEALFREALEKQRRLLGDAHLRTLVTIDKLGVLLTHARKYTEAESLLREALDNRRRMLEDEHPDVLTSLFHTGSLLRAQRRFVDAEPLLREALKGRRRQLGDDHHDTLESILELGWLLWETHRLDEAEPHLREVVERYRRGNSHPKMLTSLHLLGEVYRSQGKLSKAEALFTELLEQRRRVSGNEDPSTRTALDLLSSVLSAQARFADAEPYFRESLERHRSGLGEEHRATLGALANLGGLLQSMCRYDEAEPFLREAVEKSRRTLGDKDFTTLRSINALGGGLLAQNKPAEAIELLAPGESSARQGFTGGNAARLGQFLSVLGRSRAAAGEFDAAEDNLVEACAILSEAPGAKSEDLAITRTGLIELYYARHAAEPDKGFDAKAAELRAVQLSTPAATQSVHQ